MKKLHVIFFNFRFKTAKVLSLLSNSYWKLQGMKIGDRTFLPTIHVSWPNQVSIGCRCTIQHDVYFHYDGKWKENSSIIIGIDNFIGAYCEFNISDKITIGNDCLIAAGTKFVDHNHGIALSSLMRSQDCPSSEITIGSNVWIGANAVILKGVVVGDGAIIAAGAIVNKNVSSNEIWGGIPAKKIGIRN